MTSAIKLAIIAAFILSILLPFGYFMQGERNKKRYKRSIAANIVMFFGIVVIAAVMLFVSEPVQAAEAASDGMATGLGYIAAALATGLSCVGGGIAVASAASAALGAISEDPTALGKSLIFVGLAEGVCLYGLIISFMIIGRLG
ncbi:MAG TPA: ATP synthase subunit C [Candidatus Anaerostipes avistercoris]|uniref:ATP synthase subunit C n=1 Tax=Candidatus Anaerostipes avistercoris TaxID=2838462 RepID=A0A9D2TB19_9FIRM|nr:ATP synthase subunit C [Candidatus Anaerostipes avistercoris]